jgi:L-asparaginase
MKMNLSSSPIIDEVLNVKSVSAYRKKVLLLYTGGTMGMVHMKDGSLAPQAGYLTQSINELPEMKRPEMPLYDIKEYEPLLDSSCMGPNEWQQIATDIETNYLNYDGFVVIMGTDTMAYAASALSFMLENLGKPVVFTGSQIPFCEVYNDARRNLIVSVIFAVTSEFPEVCICFNDKLLRGNRAMKIDSGGLNAFDSPNFPPLATLGAFIRENRELVLSQPRGPFRVHKQLEAKVLVIRLVPGFDDECIMALVTHSKNLKAIVFEMYGTGNGPPKSALLDAIKLAKSKGIVIVAVTQCVQGGVSLDTYSMGKEFRESGVVSGGDMTTEACTTKLAYLFGRLSDPDLVAQLVSEDIRGEMSYNSKGLKKFFQAERDSDIHKLLSRL